jgi:Prophage tail length tape measure protein
MATLPGVTVPLGLDAASFLAGVKAAQAQMDQFSRNVTRASGQMRGAFANVGLQVQDMAVQLASGTSAMRIMTQQLPQLLSGFGGWGTAIAAVIAVGGALITYLTNQRSATEEADAETKRFAATQETLKRLLDDSTGAIRDYAAAVSGLRGVQRDLGVEDLRLQLEQANVAIARETAALSTTLQELEAVLLQPGPQEVRPGILQALSAIQEAQTRGDPAALAAAISRLTGEMTDPALLEFRERIINSGGAVVDLRANADALREALAGLGKGAVQSGAQIEAEFKRLSGIAEDFTRHFNQVRFQAQQEAAREAQQEAEAQQRFDEQRVRAENERLAGIAEQFARRANQQRYQAQQATERVTGSLQEQLKLQQLLLRGLDVESEEYRVQMRLLDLKRQLGGELTADQEGMVRQLERQASAIDQQNEAARQIEGAFSNAADAIVDADGALAARLREIFA